MNCPTDNIFYETKGAAGKTLMNWLIDCWPAQSTFVFPTMIKITKAFGFIKIGHITKIFNEKKCAAGKKIWWKHCAAVKTYETNCAAGKIFLTESWCVICPVDVVCNSLFTNHSSESSFFNWLINELEWGRPRVRVFAPLLWTAAIGWFVKSRRFFYSP